MLQQNAAYDQQSVPQRRSSRGAVNAEVYKEDDAASYVKK